MLELILLCQILLLLDMLCRQSNRIEKLKVRVRRLERTLIGDTLI